MSTVSQAGTVAVKIIGDDAGFHATLQKVDKALTSNVANFRNAIVGVAAFRTAFAGVTAPIQQTISVFASFEAGMSKVQAITGSTANEIGKLREQAKELGKTTFFTASQVADAQKFLAMAGFTKDQIAAATPKVLDLALAGDLDLGTAADIATNISTPFQIAAKDLGRVNDILAKSATTSNTNVLELGQAFKFAAPAASAAGQSIEECGAAFSVLANNGIKADMAGTAMRMMLIKLADGDIQEKLAGYGVAVTDTTGKMRPLMDVLRDLRKATDNMTQTERMSTFYDIFEARAGTAAIVLGNSGDAADNFREKMYSAFGTSSQMAKTMADNLKGDWIALTSALEGMQIAYGSAMNESLRNITTVLVTATRAMAGFIAENPDLIKNTTYLVGILTALIAVYKASSMAMAMLTARTAAQTAAQAAAAATATTSAAAETAAITQKTKALSANAAAYRAMLVAEAAKASASRTALLGNIGNNVATLTSQRAAFSAELGVLSAQRAAWEKEMQAAQISALRGSATAQKEIVVIQNEINALKTRETAINQTITTTSNQIAAAEAKRAAITRTAAVSNIEFASKLNKLELQRITTTNAATAATGRLAVSMKALWASAQAHPFMWIAGAVAGLGALTYWLTVAREKTAQLHDAAAKQRDTGDTERTADDVKFRRLQQLSESQNLSNKEQEEAARLTQELQNKYGDFGATIDGTSGSLTLAGDSMERFMDAMNAKAMKELQDEIQESEKNIAALREQADNTSVYWRKVFSNVTFGSVNTAAKQVGQLGDKILEQKQKIHAAQKRINAMKNGENAIDAAKDPTALLEEKLSKGDKKEFDHAEKDAEKIYEDRQRSRKSDMENEIADLEKRNEQYKEYLQLLLKSEKDPKKKQFYQDELNNSDKNLKEDLTLLAEKKKLLNPKAVEAPALLDKQTALADAYQSKDADKIKAAKEELKKAQEDLANTTAANLQTVYNNAKKEYEDAKAAFDSAQTPQEKLLAGEKLKEKSDEFKDAGKDYESAVERQISEGEKDKEKKLKKKVEKTKELADTNAGAGTFSAFDDYENMGNTIGDVMQKQLTQTAKSNLLLSMISNGIAEMNDDSGRFS